MGKKANPAVIGGFVVGAVVLLVVGVLVFGSGQFWKTTIPFVMYFDDSVKGLQVGAPVAFSGVKVGEVTHIEVTLDVKTTRVRTPVYVELDPSRIRAIGISQAELAKMGRRRKGGKGPIAAMLIKRGLRAQLQLRSFVTGQLFVQLDFHPDTPIRLADVDTDVPQFPTIPSGMAKLTEGLQELPLRDIGDSVLQLVEHVDQLVSSPEVKAVIVSADETLKRYEKLGRDIEEQVVPVTRDALKNIDEQVTPAAQEALTDASKLMQNIDTEVTPAARDALKQADVTLAAAEDTIGEKSELRHRLAVMLTELTAAARSIRVLAAYLERHPEALVSGKAGPGGDRR